MAAERRLDRRLSGRRSMPEAADNRLTGERPAARLITAARLAGRVLAASLLAGSMLWVGGCSRRSSRRNIPGSTARQQIPAPRGSGAEETESPPPQLQWQGIESLLAQDRRIAMVHGDRVALHDSPSAGAEQTAIAGGDRVVVAEKHAGSGRVTGDTLDSWYLVRPLSAQPTGKAGWINELDLTFFPVAVQATDGLPFAGVPTAAIVDVSIASGGQTWYRVHTGEQEYRVVPASGVRPVTGAAARRNEYCAFPFLFTLPATSERLTQLFGAPSRLKTHTYDNLHVKGKKDTLLSYLYPGLQVDIYRAYDGREFLVQVEVSGTERPMKYGVGAGVSESYVLRCLGEPDESRRRAATRILVYRYSPDVTYQVELETRRGRVQRIRWSSSFL